MAVTNLDEAIKKFRQRVEEIGLELKQAEEPEVKIEQKFEEVELPRAKEVEMLTLGVDETIDELWQKFEEATLPKERELGQMVEELVKAEPGIEEPEVTGEEKFRQRVEEIGLELKQAEEPEVKIEQKFEEVELPRAKEVEMLTLGVDETIDELWQKFEEATLPKERELGQMVEELVKAEPGIEEPEVTGEEKLTPELKQKVEGMEKVEFEGEELEELKSAFLGAEPHMVEIAEGIDRVGVYNPFKHSPLISFDTPKGYRELERYWINEPYSFAALLENEETGEYLYSLVEPELSPSERKVLEWIKETLLERMRYVESADKDRILTEKFESLMKERGNPLDWKSMHKVLYFLKRDSTAYGRIDSLMKDIQIEDLSCDGPEVPIFLYHRKFYNMRTNVHFEEKELNDFALRLAELCGKHLSLGEPVVEAALPDGSRLQATIGTQVTTGGSSFSIRKFLGSTFSPVDLIKFGTFSPSMLAYLWILAENKKSIIIVGGTASGKTSTLNSLAFFIPPDAKIVSIEDTREISLYQDNWLPSVTRERLGEKEIDMHTLVSLALRQRPECIIVGETRGKEALALFQAMSTGHTAYSTMHADTIQGAVNRLRGEPINLPSQMFQALDVICLQLLTHIGRKRVRRNQAVVEFLSVDPDARKIRVVNTFEWNASTDDFREVSESQLLKGVMVERGWTPIQLERELKNREALLKYLVDNNIKDHKQIAALISLYYYDSERAMAKIGYQPS